MSQIEFETPEPPEVVDQAGAPQRPHLGLGQAELLAGRRRQLGDRRAWPSVYGDLRSTKFAIAASAASKRSPESTTASAGSASITASQVATASRPDRIVSASRSITSANAGIELLAGALAGELPRRVHAADPVRDLDELGELREPRRQRHLARPLSSPGQPRPSHCS